MTKPNSTIDALVAYIRAGARPGGSLGCDYFSRQRMAIIGRRLKALCVPSAANADARELETSYALWLSRWEVAQNLRRADWTTLLDSFARYLDSQRRMTVENSFILRRFWLLIEHAHPGICRG